MVRGVEVHQQTQESALSGPVWPHEPDFVAPIDRARQVAQYGVISKRLADLAADDDFMTLTTAGGEVELHLGLVGGGLFHPLQAGQHFLTALRLAGFLPGDIAPDKLLLALNLCLLLFIGFALLCTLYRPGLHVGRIVAHVALQMVAVELDNFLHRPIEKIAVVGHHDHGARIGAQGAFEPFRGRNVEMVRRLIEQEQIWFLQEDTRQCRHVFLSATELGDRFV